jgi:hypothetical protein
MKILAGWGNKDSSSKVLALFHSYIKLFYLHSYAIVLTHPLDDNIRSNSSENAFSRILSLLTTDGSMNSFAYMVTYCMESDDVT